jgi:hypothetical protein
MNADEDKMLIGVYRRSSAAHKRFFSQLLRERWQSARLANAP